MILEVSRDDAARVLMHPAIFATISEDGMTEWQMPEGPIYLCGYVPELIGCFVLHRQSNATLECHVQVLPEYRKKYAQEFGKEVIRWTWQNTDSRKLVAQIPALYPNVRNFAELMGFRFEGVNQSSFIKGGQLHDQWYMGLMR